MINTESMNMFGQNKRQLLQTTYDIVNNMQEGCCTLIQ